MTLEIINRLRHGNKLFGNSGVKYRHLWFSKTWPWHGRHLATLAVIHPGKEGGRRRERSKSGSLDGWPRRAENSLWRLDPPPSPLSLPSTNITGVIS